jgi:phosphohistidine phosphatase
MGAAPQLIVMRHAAAGDLPGGPDAERALRPRGRRDATAGGAWLCRIGLVPDQVICSTARRARQTWVQVRAELDGDVPTHNDPRLYDAGCGQLLEIIMAADPAIGTLMYVGHNPAAQELAGTLTGEPRPFPTAGIAVIELPGGWASAGPGTGQLTASWAPTPAP